MEIRLKLSLSLAILALAATTLSVYAEEESLTRKVNEYEGQHRIGKVNEDEGQHGSVTGDPSQWG
ncbi:MAG: hypothetical protein R3E79_50360 [Caldilineaceae bacterium]